MCGKGVEGSPYSLAGSIATVTSNLCHVDGTLYGRPSQSWRAFSIFPQKFVIPAISSSESESNERVSRFWAARTNATTSGRGVEAMFEIDARWLMA